MAENQGSSDKSFGITFAVVFAIIALAPLLGKQSPRYLFLIFSAGFLVISFTVPHVLAPLNKLWTKFGLILHKITTPIIMGAIFFIVITPTGLIMRALGKDILKMKLDKNAGSYWIERAPPGPEPKSLKNQF